MQGGTLILTTHRVIWLSGDPHHVAGSIPLAAVAPGVELKASNVISHRKIRLHVSSDGQGRPLAGAQVLARASMHCCLHTFSAQIQPPYWSNAFWHLALLLKQVQSLQHGKATACAI